MNPGNDHNGLYEFYVLGLLEERERGRIFEAFSQTEMAERAKQPLGTVKTWVQVLRSEREQAVPA